MHIFLWGLGMKKKYIYIYFLIKKMKSKNNEKYFLSSE